MLEGCYKISPTAESDLCHIKVGSNDEKVINCKELLEKDVLGTQMVKFSYSFIPGLFFKEADYAISDNKCGYILGDCSYCKEDISCKEKCEKDSILFFAWEEVRKLIIDDIEDKGVTGTDRAMNLVSYNGDGKTKVIDGLYEKLFSFNKDELLEKEARKLSIAEVAFLDFQEEVRKETGNNYVITFYDTLKPGFVDNVSAGNYINIEVCFARYNFNKIALDIAGIYLNLKVKEKLANFYAEDLALCNYIVDYRKAQYMYDKGYYQYCKSKDKCDSGCTMKKDDPRLDKNTEVIFTGPGRICIEDDKSSFRIEKPEYYNVRYVGYIKDGSTEDLFRYTFMTNRDAKLIDKKMEKETGGPSTEQVPYNPI